MNNKNIRIGILVANEADEMQLIIPVQIWKKAGFIVELISLEKKNSVILKHEVKVSCNGTIDKINLSQFNSIYIPGGDSFKKFLDPKFDQKIMKTLQKDFLNDKKNIFAMGEALKILIDWDLLNKRKCTGHISLKNEVPSLFDTKSNIVVSKGLITARGSLNSYDFAMEVVKYHSGSAAQKKIINEFQNQ